MSAVHFNNLWRHSQLNQLLPLVWFDNYFFHIASYAFCACEWWHTGITSVHLSVHPSCFHLLTYWPKCWTLLLRCFTCSHVKVFLESSAVNLYQIKQLCSRWHRKICDKRTNCTCRAILFVAIFSKVICAEAYQEVSVRRKENISDENKFGNLELYLWYRVEHVLEQFLLFTALFV